MLVARGRVEPSLPDGAVAGDSAAWVTVLPTAGLPSDELMEGIGEETGDRAARADALEVGPGIGEAAASRHG